MKRGDVFWNVPLRTIYVATRGDPRPMLMELFGVSIRSVSAPGLLESQWEHLGNPDLDPVGWIALYEGVRAAKDHAGREEAVRTAAERAKDYGPPKVQRNAQGGVVWLHEAKVESVDGEIGFAEEATR